ncbi:hypothetical protein [Pararhodonellum marinum]|uniref:hypothetical protein n=1 Tax=Pararhodonellum marinum TaxID=2755358 RepID=UPI00188E5547|nr:hypothetical protein [Pararhodonellum marinum]
MDSENFKFWQKWLTWANVLTLTVGLLVAFAGNSLIFGLHNSFSQEVFFDGEPFTEQTLKFKNWLFGIIGGTIVGFHVLMIFISENAFKNKEKWAYWAMWLGLCSWFLIDSLLSIYHGALYNVLMINLVALFLIGLPLTFTFKAFHKEKQ